MQVTMTKCDNPYCNSVESFGTSPPYPWLKLTGHFEGSGPNVEVEVCKVSCLEEAVMEKVKQAAETQFPPRRS